MVGQYKHDHIEGYNYIMKFAEGAAILRRKIESMSEEERTKRAKDIEDREERNRVLWFIHQGKCPYCGTKLKRGKKVDHIRKWWCIKCNINLSKED